MKKMFKILSALLAIIVLLVVGLEFSLDGMLHRGFNRFAPDALGVPATLADAKLSLFRGSASLEGLHIGNPPGFNTPGLLDLSKVSVKLDNASLLTDTIVIKEILIDGLVVTYEKGLRDSNLGALIESLTPADEPDSDKDKEKQEAAQKKKEKAADQPGKKVVIEKLAITGSKMNVSMTGLSAVTGGGAIPIPLPPITLTDLGKEKEGVTVVEAIQRVLTEIAGAAGTAIAGSAKLLGEGLGALGEGATDAGKAVVGGAVDAGKAVGGAAVDTGKAVVGGAVDAGKAVGGAAAGAGRAIGGALHKINPLKHDE